MEAESTLSNFRAGLTEINETKENANRILVGRLDWKLRCRAGMGEYEVRLLGRLKLDSEPTYRIEIDYELGPQPVVERILVVAENVASSPAARRPAFTGLEFRPSEQRRGFPLRSGVRTESAGLAEFILDRTDGDGVRDVSRLTQNSQWLDVPMTRDRRRLILTVELPQLRNLGVP